MDEKMNNFSKILIANRGEIAARIMRTARKLGIWTVAVYSEQDKNSYHALGADEAYFIGPGSLPETYLNQDKILQIAIQSKVDAIHPGYGFLSENPEFAEKCRKKGIVFIGPGAETIRTMGNKVKATEFISKLNIPVLDMHIGKPNDIISRLSDADFPVMIKAAAGGGGKGMRIVRQPDQLQGALEQTAREAYNYFGNSEVFVEKFINNPRHIEIQILGDHYGNFLHLFERECSVQRRHQKIIEEAPSPALTDELRAKLTQAAIKIAKAIKYFNAGTIEFMVDANENFYFLEMNTRIQVEHPVTELITGIDIVEEQIRIAREEQLRWNQSQIQRIGHAIEARIYAEEPENNFAPSPGKIQLLQIPEEQNLRIDSGINSGEVVSTEYDPMIAKIIAWGEDRNKAISNLSGNMQKIAISGIGHNISYLQEILLSDKFQKHQYTTNYIDERNEEILESLTQRKKAADRRILVAAYIFINTHIHRNNTELEQAFRQIGYWRHYMKWNIKIGDERWPAEFYGNNNELYIETTGEKYKAELSEIQSNHIIFQVKNQKIKIHYSGKPGKTQLIFGGLSYDAHHNDFRGIILNKPQAKNTRRESDTIISPMYGKVVQVNVDNNTKVNKGQTLLVIDAMKMENNIVAPGNLVVKNLRVKKGDQVKDGQILAETVLE
ncbi:MAG: acetyl/propionyl/methylcrotonyl-CoA carboxylase subunit alpha [Bacteroidales bacterium]